MAMATEDTVPAAAERAHGEGGEGTSATLRLTRLRAALRRERARGRAGHWTYDLARHLSLAHQLKEAERASRAAAVRRA